MNLGAKMFKLFSGGNFQEVVDRVTDEKMSIVNASFSSGIITILAKESTSKGSLKLFQGYNSEDLIEQVNAFGEVEFSIIDSPCKFFFVREKSKK